MKTFYEDMQNVREGTDVEESLERLVKSTLLDRQAIFYWDRWIVLCDYAKANGSDVDFTGKEAWYELLRPALFLAIHNTTDTKWESLMEEQLFDVHESRLFLYLRSAIRAEIETFIFNGATLSQHTSRVCDVPEYVLENVEAPQNTETQAETEILLGQIRDELDEDEWLIVTTTDYGDGRELANDLGITEEALRKRRQRIRERLRGKFRH